MWSRRYNQLESPVPCNQQPSSRTSPLHGGSLSSRFMPVLVALFLSSFISSRLVDSGVLLVVHAKRSQSHFRRSTSYSIDPYQTRESRGSGHLAFNELSSFGSEGRIRENRNIPNNIRFLSKNEISRSDVVSLYRTFCPTFDFSSASDANQTLGCDANTTFMANVTTTITACNHVHTLIDAQVKSKPSTQEILFRFHAIRQDTTYKVVMVCSNSTNDETCRIRGINCLDLCSDCDNNEWLCPRKQPFCGCSNNTCYSNETEQPSCPNCTTLLPPRYTIPRASAINFYQDYCPKFDVVDGKKKLCGSGGVKSQILYRCGMGHELWKLKAAGVTTKTTYFYYTASRSNRHYGVTMSCPMNDPTNTTCDIHGLNCLEPCRVSNQTWLCPDTRPTCGCTYNSCLDAKDQPVCTPSNNSTSPNSTVTSNSTNATDPGGSTILFDDAVRIYQDFCPNFRRNSTNQTCGSGGLTNRNLTWCGYSHMLVKSKDVVLTSNSTVFYYNASRSGLIYSVVVSCPNSNSNATKCNIQGLNCLDSCNACNSSWLCSDTQPVCGCTAKSCLAVGSSPNCTASLCDIPTNNATNVTSTNATISQLKTMTALTWDTSGAATIEFCQRDNTTFGYRLPGEPTCGPAGLLIRVDSNKNYQLTLRNNSTQTTGLMVQGLFISGDGNANNVDRVVDPGKCITYYWNIRSDQMGGIFLMHASSGVNGTMSQQVDGGAFSTFVVRPSTSLFTKVNSTFKNDLNTWSNRQRFLVVSRSKSGKVLGNGRSDTVQSLILGEWYRLRVMAIDVTGARNNLDLPSTCDSYAVAFDGVWRFVVPDLTSTRSFSMPGGSRLDVALRCNVTGAYNVSFAGKPVAVFNVSEGTLTTASPFAGGTSQWSPLRPTYLSDMQNESIVTNFTLSVFNASINSVQYDPSTPLRSVTYGSVEEWSIVGAKNNPVRTSTFPVQVMSCPGYISGEFYDTITATDTITPCRVRLRFINFSGKFVTQSNAYNRAQNGARAWMNVTAGGTVQSTTDFSQKVCT